MDSKSTPASAKKPLTRRKRLAFCAVLGCGLLLCTFVLVLIAELVSSLFGVEIPTQMYIRNARLNHTWPPYRTRIHSEWIDKNPEFPDPYPHLYNGQGWVETYDVAIEKPPGVYRIFYVGDSFTEGCVPMDQTIPSAVERYVNEFHSNQKIEFEVINTGTSSYSPIIYYILVRYFLHEYSPDLIVVNVDMTDVYDDWKYRKLLITDDDGNPYACPHRSAYDSDYVDTLQGAMKATWMSRLRLFLFQNSMTYNLIASKTGRQGHLWSDNTNSNEEPDTDLLLSRWAWCGHQWDSETEENVAFTLDVLGRLADYCAEHDIKLLLTGVLHYQQFVGPDEIKPRWSNRPHLELQRLAAEKNIAYLSSYDVLAPHINKTEQHEFYYRGDMHFNPRGFKLWADAQIDAITDPQRRLLPPEAY